MKSTDEIEYQTKDREPLSKSLPKILVSLLTISVILSFTLFLLIILFFLFAIVFEAIFTSKEMITEGILFDFFSEILKNTWFPVAVSFFISAIVIPVILVCVGLVGLPVSLIMWRYDLIQKRNCLRVGFLLGSAPGFFLPLISNIRSNTSSFANGIHYWIQGVPTLAGIIQLIIMALITGVLGGIGGYFFWLVWNFLTPKKLS